MRCWQGVFLLRLLSWLADSCLLHVPTWPFSVYADPLVSVLMRTLLSPHLTVITSSTSLLHYKNVC